MRTAVCCITITRSLAPLVRPHSHEINDRVPGCPKVKRGHRDDHLSTKRSPGMKKAPSNILPGAAGQMGKKFTSRCCSTCAETKTVSNTFIQKLLLLLAICGGSFEQQEVSERWPTKMFSASSITNAFPAWFHEQEWLVLYNYRSAKELPPAG